MKLCFGSVTLMSCMNISPTIMDEMLKVAIADNQYVRDIEHLEGSLLKIYGTIFFPINLKPMTTKESGVIVCMDSLATNYANMDCRNKNLTVLTPDGKWIKIQGERQRLRKPVISCA